MRNEDGYWHRLVLQKLYELHRDGASFKNTPWDFSWDKAVSLDENLDGCLHESKVLQILTNKKVIATQIKANDIRQEYIEGKRRGVDIYGWDIGDEEIDNSPGMPALKYFDGLAYLWGLDYGRFEAELAKFGLKDSGTKLVSIKASDIRVILTPRSYESRSGILYIGSQSIQIVKQKAKLSGKNESLQGRVMRLLFNDVNSMKNGVPLRRISNFTSVNGQALSKTQRASAKNQIDAINKKVKPVAGAKKLIRIAKDRCYIDPMYL